MTSPYRAPAESERGLGRWGTLGILMMLAFLNYLNRNLIFPVLGLIADELHVRVDELGAVATGFHVVYALSAPLLGAVSDRVSRKTILLVALVSWSIVTALSGLATGFTSLLVFRALTGLGEGGYFPTAVSLIGDLFGPTQRGLAIALHGVCTTLGGSAGYAVGGALGARFGWRVPFFLAVIPGLALAVVLAFWLREPPRGKPPAEGKTEQRAQQRPYAAIILSPAVAITSIAACAGAFAMNGLNTFLPLYLVEARGVSVQSAGVLTGVFFSMTLFGQLGGGILSDRLASRLQGTRPLLFAIAYLAVAPAAFVMPHAGAVLVALMCYGATQFGRGFAEPNIYGTIIDGVPAHERGTAQGFLLMLTFAGASASPWLAGILIGRSGYTSAIRMLSIASAAAGALALGLFLYQRRFHSAVER